MYAAWPVFAQAKGPNFGAKDLGTFSIMVGTT